LLRHLELAVRELAESLDRAKRSHWNEYIRDDAKIVLETLSMVSREGAFACGMNFAKDGRKARRDRE
jgi:hypothetical protein